MTTFPDAGTYFPDASSSYTHDLIGVVWVTFDPRTAGRGWDDANHLCGSCRSAEQCLPQHRRRPKLGGGPGSTDGVSAAPRQTGVQRNAHISYSNGAGPYDGSSGDVWKLDTSAGTWTRVSPVPSTDTANDYFGYGGLSVDAQHPDTIAVASLNSWWPDTIFFRSRDGGATWNRVWNWGPWPTLVASYTLEYSAAPWLTFGSPPSPCTSALSTNSLCPQPTPKLGWMVGSLEVDPFNSDHMLYGTGATIFGTGNLTAWDSGGSFQVSLNARGVEESGAGSDQPARRAAAGQRRGGHRRVHAQRSGHARRDVDQPGNWHNHQSRLRCLKTQLHGAGGQRQRRRSEYRLLE